MTEWGTQVWYHDDPDLTISRVKDLGLEWIRLEYWIGHEAYIDSVITACETYGIKVLLLLAQPCHDVTITPAEYGAEAERLLTKYNLNVVELMNEPGTFYEGTPETYVELIHQGYLAAKRVNPNCTVLGGYGTSSAIGNITYAPEHPFELAWLKDLGFMNYVDALAVHPYCFGNDPDEWSGIWVGWPDPYMLPGGIPAAVDWMREFMTPWGYGDIPLWATEWNVRTDQVGVENQINWGIREMEILRDKGFHSSFWYPFWVPAGTPRASYASLVNDDATLSPKPMFTAYQNFITPTPPTHLLTVNSTPIEGIPFTVDTRQEVTPASLTLDEGSYTVVMPSNIQVGADVYNFARWEDASTNPSRPINLTAPLDANAEFELATPPPPAKGYLKIHAFLGEQEIVAPYEVVEAGLTGETPTVTPLELDPGFYTVTVTYKKPETKTVEVFIDQTIRLDFQFIVIPPCPLAVIATAVYGSSLELNVFRNFRDNFMACTKMGRWLASNYYRIGKYVAPTLQNKVLTKKILKGYLNVIKWGIENKMLRRG